VSAFSELDFRPFSRHPVNGRPRTLADVAKALADAGYLSSAGTQYTPTAVSRMLASGRSALAKLARQRKVETKSSPSALEPAAAELQHEIAEPAMRTPLGSRW